jgi:hypothetical protein
MAWLLLLAQGTSKGNEKAVAAVEERRPVGEREWQAEKRS